MGDPAPETIPDAVLEAIRNAFPKSADVVLATMRWSSLDGCYLAEIHGMTVGIELDGYVHS